LVLAIAVLVVDGAEARARYDETATRRVRRRERERDAGVTSGEIAEDTRVPVCAQLLNGGELE
jgi:hypothetical protein